MLELQASDRIADLVEYVVTSLVDNPDDVFLDIVDSDEGTLIEINVAQEDMGKVIGRNGRVIKALRTVARAAAAHEHARVEVEVIDKHA